MCIRDSQRAAGLEKEGLFAAIPAVLAFPAELEPQGQNQQDDTDDCAGAAEQGGDEPVPLEQHGNCLLYTSDRR